MHNGRDIAVMHFSVDITYLHTSVVQVSSRGRYRTVNGTSVWRINRVSLIKLSGNDVRIAGSRNALKSAWNWKVRIDHWLLSKKIRWCVDQLPAHLRTTQVVFVWAVHSLVTLTVDDLLTEKWFCPLCAMWRKCLPDFNFQLLLSKSQLTWQTERTCRPVSRPTGRLLVLTQ